MNGTDFQIPTGSYYPLFNASDNVTWQHGKHTFNFGASWWREQDHYYNGVQGEEELHDDAGVHGKRRKSTVETFSIAAFRAG